MGKKKNFNSKTSRTTKSNLRYRVVAFLLIIMVIIVGKVTAKREEALPAFDPIAFLTKQPTATSQPPKSNQPTTSEQPTKANQPSDSTTGEVPELKVHFIDVGQADAILIESEGKFMLVDGGNTEDKEVVLDYLEAAGVTRLEYIVGTHPHEDHIGALDDVIESYEVSKIYAPHIEHTSQTYYSFLEAAVLKKLTLRQPKVKSEIKLGDCTVTFLAPNAEYKNDLNNWSIGLKVTNGVHTFVMCGDAEEKAEEDILANGIDINGDVLKLGHHGSSTSTSDEFLKAVSPDYAVISVGEGNTYGHPHGETLKKVEEGKIQLFRTDMQGTIIATSDGNEITWNVAPINQR